MGAICIRPAMRFVSLVTAITAVAAYSNETCTACGGANLTYVSVSKNQLWKNPRPVELRGSGRAVAGMSNSEWQDRLELAALARILYMYGTRSRRQQPPLPPLPICQIPLLTHQCEQTHYRLAFAILLVACVFAIICMGRLRCRPRCSMRHVEAARRAGRDDHE